MGEKEKALAPGLAVHCNSW